MEQVITIFEAFYNLHVSVKCVPEFICHLKDNLEYNVFSLFIIIWFIPITIMLIYVARWISREKTRPPPQPRAPEPRRHESRTPLPALDASPEKHPNIVFPEYIVTDEEETLALDCSSSSSWERTAHWVATSNFLRAWREYRGCVEVHENYMCDSCIYCKSDRNQYLC